MKFHYLIYVLLLFLSLSSCETDELANKGYIVKEGVKYAIKNGDAIVVGYDENYTKSELTICSTVLYKKENYNVTQIADNAFKGCEGFSSITLPSSLTSVGEYAFRDCKNLTSIAVPKNVTNLGLGAFFGCSKIESATLPDGITILNDAVFHDCVSLTSVNIPLNCTSIGSETFWNCGITSIRIPAKVTRIGWQAFYNSNKLANVTCLANTPPQCEGGPFSTSQTLHVPSGCKTKYQSTLYWKDFKSIVEDAN